MKISDFVRVPLRLILSPLLGGVEERNAWSILSLIFWCCFTSVLVTGVYAAGYKFFTDTSAFASLLVAMGNGTLIAYGFYGVGYHLETDLFKHPIKVLYRFKNWLLQVEDK